MDSIVKDTSDTTLEIGSTSAGGKDRERIEPTDKTPLEMAKLRRQSMKKLVRQSSTVDTQKNSDGSIQLTYWF